MPLPLAAGLAIGAMGSIFSNAASNKASSDSQAQANRDNIEFWNMQNDYNHPSKQMSRLREAGLNPNLIYGTPQAAAVGNAEKIGPSKAAPKHFDNPTQSALAMSVGRANTEAQTDNLRTQNTVLQEEAMLKRNQINGVMTDNLQKALNLANDQKYSAEGRALANQLAERQVEGLGLENTFKEGTLNARMDTVNKQLDYIVANTNKTNLEATLLKSKAEMRTTWGIETGDNLFFRWLSKQNQAIQDWFQQNGKLNPIFTNSNN